MQPQGSSTKVQNGNILKVLRYAARTEEVIELKNLNNMNKRIMVNKVVNSVTKVI